MNKEPLKPICVPVEAIWNGSENEWETGQYDESGNPVGEWKWWAAPSGYLVCHTIYTGVRTFTYTRFHPDGTPSQIGQYVNGMMDGTYTCIRSESQTNEHFSPKAGKNVWKAVAKISRNVTLEERYYDRDGNEIQQPYISEVSSEEIPEIIKHFANVKANMADKMWHKALEELDRIEKDILLENKEEEMEFLYYKIFNLYEQSERKLIPEILQGSERILQCYTFGLWAYLRQHNILRTAIRTAYNFLALKELEQDNTDNALDYVNKLMDISSPIEDADVFYPYLETIALAFLRKYRQEEQYRFQSMQAMLKLELSQMEIRSEELKKELLGADYQNFKNNNPLNRLGEGLENETWQQAVERYEKLLTTLNIADDCEIIFSDKADVGEMAKLEKNLNCPIPQSLQDMYTQTGAFSIGDDWNSLGIFRTEGMMKDSCGLIYSIDYTWGGRPEFEEELTPEEIKTLDTNYFVFGQYYIDDNQHIYLYFDRAGNFGSIFFDQDDFDVDVFREMVDASPAANTLDEVISEIIDSMVETTLEDYA